MNKIQHVSVGDIISNVEAYYEGFGLKDRITRDIRRYRRISLPCSHKIHKDRGEAVIQLR